MNLVPLSYYFVLTLLGKGVFEVRGGSTYTLHTEYPGPTWHQAKARCEQMGERLAVLNRRGKQDEAMRQIVILQHVFPWIGFHDEKEDDVFVWVNGEKVEDGFRNWKPGYTRKSYENCGYLNSNGQWLAYECYSASVYLCERVEPDSERKCLVPVNKIGNGNGSDILTDDSTTTCALIPRSDECCKVEYSIIVNGSCIHDNVFNINITMVTGSVCNDVTSVMFVSKVSRCDGNVKRGSRCEVVSADVINDKITCSMRCECAESADRCLAHLYSGLSQVDVEICEMQIEG